MSLSFSNQALENRQKSQKGNRKSYLINLSPNWKKMQLFETSHSKCMRFNYLIFQKLYAQIKVSRM